MYRPRDAEHTVLHQVIAEHLEAFLGAVAEAGDGAGLPQFVEREFRDFLLCGVFEAGVARFQCEDCGREHLVPVVIVPSCAGWPFAAQATRGQPAVRAHHAQHTLAARGGAAVGEPRPHLAIALPMKRARRQDGADLRHQRGIAARGLRPPLPVPPAAPPTAPRTPTTAPADTLRRSSSGANGYRRPVPGLRRSLIPCASSTRP